MSKIRTWLVPIVSVLVAVPAAPSGVAHAAACATTVDIGLTVYDRPHNVVKGSGSYTTRSCRAIYSVYLVIMRGPSPNNMAEISATKVTRYPPEPSSAKFSPKDHVCPSHSSWNWYKTKISAKYSGGGSTIKYSNAIRVDCP